MFRIEMPTCAGNCKGPREGILPLAVIGVAGTTEEGAVDPIHHCKPCAKKFSSATVKASGFTSTPRGEDTYLSVHHAEGDTPKTSAISSPQLDHPSRSL